MAVYARFEDMPVWKAAKELAVQIYSMTSSGKFAKERALSHQIRSAVVSVSSNIAEGFELGTHKEFARHLYIARGSCGEVRSQVRIAKELGYIDAIRTRTLTEASSHLSKQLTLLLASLKRKISSR